MIKIITFGDQVIYHDCFYGNYDVDGRWGVVIENPDFNKPKETRFITVMFKDTNVSDEPSEEVVLYENLVLREDER